MSIKNLSEVRPQNRKVILRCDLNVPLKNGVIVDDGRIVASLSTLKELLENNCSIIVIAHLGRPKGQVNPDLSLQPIAKRLGELLKREVKFSKEIHGIKTIAQSLAPGEILMLENIRFLENETSKEEGLRNKLAKELSEYGDFYVGDGFGAVHRKHASVYELARLLPHCAGNLISNEVGVLEKLSANPDRPYGVVLG
ncbi:MAG: phosphoglycerate kinase, partial [Candidatus Nanopelagicus sp.]